MPNKDNYLVISAIGTNRNGLVESIAKAVKDAGCNILDSRMTVLGREFSMVMLLSGAWDAIAKMENVLPRLEGKVEVSFLSKRTQARDQNVWIMPYAVEVISIQRPGIVYDVSHFFASRDIGIEDMYTSAYAAAHTGTPMFSLHLTISVPSDTSIATLRGEFMDFCDHLNLDSVMEPVK